MTTPRVPRLHVAYYSDAAQRGGAEIALGTLLSCLDPGIETTIIGADDAVVDWLASRRPSSRTVLLPPVHGIRDVSALRAHRRAIRTLGPDIFQANLTSLMSCRYPLAIAATVRGVHVVAVEHSTFVVPSLVRLAIKRVTARRLAAHVAVSDDTARAVERIAQLPAGSITTIHNGVEDVVSAPPPPPRVADGVIVGCIARLEPGKGQSTLIRAMTRAPGITVVFVGDGEDRADLTAKAERAGVSARVHFTGSVEVEEARSLLGSFDVSALPSREEGLPLTILEAMMAELPVVATPVGGVPEAVVPGETGMLVPVDDDAALAEALRALADDADLRARMGRAGRRRAVEHFSAAAMAQAYERLYREITAARTR
jgi:glycosyltransferase involved in cell wall biosynthesis